MLVSLINVLVVFFSWLFARQSAELRKFLITIWRTFISSVCWYVHCTNTVYFVVLSSRAAVWLKSRLRIFLIRVRLEERKKIRLDMSILIPQHFYEFLLSLCAKKFRLRFEIVLKHNIQEKNSFFSKFQWNSEKFVKYIVFKLRIGKYWEKTYTSPSKCRQKKPHLGWKNFAIWRNFVLFLANFPFFAEIKLFTKFDWLSS